MHTTQTDYDEYVTSEVKKKIERADLSALSDRADRGVIETVTGKRYVLEGDPLQTICSDCLKVPETTEEGGRKGESGRGGGGSRAAGQGWRPIVSCQGGGGSGVVLHAYVSSLTRHHLLHSTQASSSARAITKT